jgi:DNA repair protein RadA/Sms
LLCAGIAEFDQAVGGGFVPGSVLSLGGAPGIGKSFLLIQIWARLAATYRRVVVDQVRLRAILRLGLLPGA